MNTPPSETSAAPAADIDFAPGASSPRGKILPKHATGDNVTSPDALAAAKLAAATLSDSAIPPITTTAAPDVRTHRKIGGTISPVSPIFPGRSSRGSSPPRSHRHLVGSSPQLSATGVMDETQIFERSVNRPLVSSSPKLSATGALDESQIFERNVQDPSLPPPSSPAIPAHIQTENYIPPVLEATSLAITDPNVNPDFVEIVSTSTHETVASSDTYASPMSEEVPSGIASPSSTAADDGLSNSEISDAEKRRLSFISFADVVHAEQAELSQSTDGLAGSHSPPRVAHSPPTVPVTGVSANAVAAAQAAHAMHHRTPSPIRSIGSSAGSPPPGQSGLSVGNLDKDKARNPVHSELTVETLSQALRRHGSGDLGAASRSHPISATEENTANPFKK